MSIYQEYDKLVYWNKATNIQLFKNVMDSLDSLEFQFKSKKQKRLKQKAQIQVRSKANEIFFNIVIKLSQKYPGFNAFNQNSINKHCLVIEMQLAKNIPPQTLQNIIFSQIQSTIAQKLKSTSKKNNQLLHNPSYAMNQMDFKSNQKIQLSSYVCMLNLFSKKNVFKLVTTHEQLIQSQKVIYFKDSQSIQVPILNLMTNIQDGIQCYDILNNKTVRYTDKQTGKNINCSRIDILYFILYYITIADVQNKGIFKSMLSKQLDNPEVWDKFQQKLPFLRGYLEINNYYYAYTYLYQNQ